MEIPEGMTCTWLVEVPSGNPEPDFPSDCWTVVECGAPVSEIPPAEVGGFEGGYECSVGHRHEPLEWAWRIGGTDWQLEQAERMGDR
jgi:hypothetical protein